VFLFVCVLVFVGFGGGSFELVCVGDLRVDQAFAEQWFVWWLGQKVGFCVAGVDVYDCVCCIVDYNRGVRRGG